MSKSDLNDKLSRESTLEGDGGLLSFTEDDFDQMREVSFAELSALCSNLSKGCEKQYLNVEAELFNKLSQYYKGKSKIIKETNFDDLIKLIQDDLNSKYPHAHNISTDEGDRGALRALTWGEKITKILNNLIARYEKQGDILLENTNVYVCEICGFIYIGDNIPDVCPICKVPNIKISQVKRG